jgi:hypothetical protein
MRAVVAGRVEAGSKAGVGPFDRPLDRLGALSLPAVPQALSPLNGSLSNPSKRLRAGAPGSTVSFGEHGTSSAPIQSNCPRRPVAVDQNPAFSFRFH